MRLVILAALAALFPFGANAQSESCGPHAQVLEHLRQAYGEQQVMLAPTDRGDAMMVTAKDGGTWTLLQVRPDGITCIVVSGDAFSFRVPGRDS